MFMLFNLSLPNASTSEKGQCICLICCLCLIPVHPLSSPGEKAQRQEVLVSAQLLSQVISPWGTSLGLELCSINWH